MTDAEKVREETGGLVVHGAYSHHSTASVFCSACTEVERDALLQSLKAAEERAEKAEAEWKQRHLDGTGKRRLERAEARIQELEAATRHLFAELDRGYGAAEAFGRLRRVLLAGGEA